MHCWKPWFLWMVHWEVWIPIRADYVSVLTVYFPIIWLVQGENRPPLSPVAGMDAYLIWVLSLVLSVPRIAVTWACDQLDWFLLIIITFINTNSPFSRTPQERESKLSLLHRLSHAYFSVIFLGCLELFSTLTWMSSGNVALELASSHTDQPPTWLS
jgi:hypothetical protein